METFIPMQDILNRIKLNKQLTKEDRESFGFHTNRKGLSANGRVRLNEQVKKTKVKK